MAQLARPEARDKAVELLQAPKDEAHVVAPMTFIGGGGGTQKSVTAWKDGKRVTKLRVYSGYSQIKAIRLWLSGDEEGNYKEFGNPDGSDYREFTFEDGERVDKMSLWGNGAGTAAGWIYFHTNKGKSFDYGMYGWPKHTAYEVNVGSGILVGAVYNAGGDIYAHGYYFLISSIASTQVSNVSYPTLNWDSQSINPAFLDTFNEDNPSSATNGLAWKFSGNTVVTASNAWTSSTEQDFSVDVKFKAEVPEVVEVEGSFGWRLSKSSSHEQSETLSHTLEWENSGTLDPGQSIHLVAVTRKGNLSVPYTSTATVTLKNGATFSFPQQGTYTGISFTGVKIERNPDSKHGVPVAKK